MNHWRQGQVCTHEEDMDMLDCIPSECSNATDRRKKMVTDEYNKLLLFPFHPHFPSESITLSQVILDTQNFS